MPVYGGPEEVWRRLHRRSAADRGVLRDELGLLRDRAGIALHHQLAAGS
ncbi:hypothetical protein [Micromonospora nigra]|nr:hypothetical protein [Micromonospora nigra]